MRMTKNELDELWRTHNPFERVSVELLKEMKRYDRQAKKSVTEELIEELGESPV